MSNQEILHDAIRKYPELEQVLIECDKKLSRIDENYEIIDILEENGRLHYNAIPSGDDMWDWKLENMFNRTIQETQEKIYDIWVENGKII